MTIPFFLNYALKMLILLMVRQAHHERNQHKPFVLSLSEDLFRGSLSFINHP
jgi:hypothetical protein